MGLFWDFGCLTLDKQWLETDSARERTGERGPARLDSGALGEKPDVEHVPPCS